MKYKLGLAVIVMGTLMAPSKAADIEAGAGARIMEPLQLEKLRDLYFGTVVPSRSVDAQVQIDSNGTKICDAELTCLTDDHTSAFFAVEGENQATYTITVTNSIQITNGTGGAMTVSNFSSSKQSGLLLGGTDDFTVGGVLSVSANQPAGDYTGAFSVTVEYQ